MTTTDPQAKLSFGKRLIAEDVRNLLRSRVKMFGSQRAVAKAIGVSPCHVE